MECEYEDTQWRMNNILYEILLLVEEEKQGIINFLNI